MQCPQCESSQVQRSEVIHLQGTSLIETTSQSGGFGNSTSTSGTQRSLLAEKLSPPGRALSMTLMIYGIVLLAAASLRSATLVKLTYVALGIWSWYMAYQWNQLEETPRRLVWTRQWHCNSCGHLFYAAGAWNEYKLLSTKRDP